MGEAATTKGMGIVLARTFIVERFGPVGLTAVLEHLSPSDRREVEHVLPVGWCSVDLLVRLLRAMDRVHGAGDCALVVQLGRFQAERELQAGYRSLPRGFQPALLASRLPELWRRQYDGIELVIGSVPDEHMEGMLVSRPAVDPVLCRYFGGFLGRLLELLGARFAWVEFPRLGEQACPFLARWTGVQDVETEASSAVAPPAESCGGTAESGVTSVPSARDFFAASVESLNLPDSKRRAGER